jgi:hypothetical protein
MAHKKEVTMEGAPYWYNTPLDKLDFEWSRDEELEIERYCEKILKNVAEEEMTPVERWKANMAGKPKDRQLMIAHMKPVRVARVLDDYADALKPIDVYRSPKLLVKGMLAAAARFKLDYTCFANISYTEEIWGGRSKLVEYGNPCPVGDPPIKSMKDLEGLEVPDPYKVGLYPGWLWVCREIRRIVDQYHLPLPVWVSMCPGAAEVAMLGMMGWTPFVIALRKNPELARACVDLAHQWNVKFARALIDVARPEGIYCCQFTGGFPLKGSEWVADKWAELAKTIKAMQPGVHLSHGYSFLSGVFQWYPILWDHNAMTPDTFDGGHGGYSQDIDMKGVFNWHRDHNLYLSYSILDATLEKGPISAIEEEFKALCEFSKSQHPKFAPAINPTYFTPDAHIDAAVAAFKKYSKY